MEKKEPYATKEEYDKRVVRHEDVPPISPFPGASVHFITGEKLSLLFSTLPLMVLVLFFQ